AAPAADAPAAPAGAEQPAQPNPATRGLTDILDHMSKATEDETPGVAEWARFELARNTTAARSCGLVESLLADSRWEGRLLGLIATGALDHGVAMELIGKLAETDPD